MRAKRLFLALAITLAMGFITTIAAQPCDCAPRASVEDSFISAAAVIAGKITATHRGKNAQGVEDVNSVTMTVLRVYKGRTQAGASIKLAQGDGTACAWRFDETSVGLEFLLYLTDENIRTAVWTVPLCSRSDRWESSAADVRYLENRSAFRGRTRLAGLVSKWDGDPEPAAGVTVTLTGVERSFELKTDARGVYEVYDLPPGPYQVQAETPAGWKLNGYLTGHTPNLDRAKWTPELLQIPIIVEAGKPASLDFHFQPDNALRGKIVDAQGRPFTNVYVHAVVPGAPTTDDDLVDWTRDDGTFSIERLPTGRYQLSISEGVAMDGRTPFEPFFYPKTNDRKRAEVFQLEPGKIIDLTIRPREAVETIIITGRVIYADGAPAVRQYVGFDPAEPRFDVMQSGAPRSDAEGRFSLRVLKGAVGSLIGYFQPTAKELRQCPAWVEVVKGDFRFPRVVETPKAQIKADRDLDGVTLSFPFAGCLEALD